MSLSPRSLERLVESMRNPAQPDELRFEQALTDNALRTLGPVAPPPDLALRIRLVLSHERARARRNPLQRLRDRAELFVENSLRPIAVQASVVAVALVAAAGAIITLGVPQQAVEANDEPLAGFSAPHYLYSAAAEQPLASTNEAPLIVKASVDAGGRVYDYQVLSGALDAQSSAALRQRMLTGVFRPARVFDQAVRGTVLLTFGDVVVRG